MLSTWAWRVWITAKRSSIRTVVSGSVRGVWVGSFVVVGGAGGFWGAGWEEVRRDVAEGRRGSGGMGSLACEREVVEAREGWRVWMGSREACEGDAV